MSKKLFDGSGSEAPPPGALLEVVPVESADTPQIEPASLEDIEQEIDNKKLDEIAPTVGALPLDKDTIERFIQRLAHRCFLSSVNAFAAIALLMLKGAASKSAPDKMFVEVIAIDGSLIKVYKGQLLEVLQELTGNKFIRRLAESLAVSICTFAEKHGLSGDLAFTFDIQELAKENTPLNPKERAWANSFCQHVTDLETRSSARVKALLGQDYQKRFEKKKTKKKKKEERPAQKTKKEKK